MSDISLLTISAADRSLLMRLTAEMLAFPFRVCGRRDCRRALGCGYRCMPSGEPACIHRLHAPERETFDQLFALVLRIADALALERPSRDADARALEETAIDIVLVARRMRPRLGHLFPDWLAKYRAAALMAGPKQVSSHA